MGADEAQLEDVTQSGDSPGGAGSERSGRAIRYRNGTHDARNTNTSWSGGQEEGGALNLDVGG